MFQHISNGRMAKMTHNSVKKKHIIDHGFLLLELAHLRTIRVFKSTILTKTSLLSEQAAAVSFRQMDTDLLIYRVRADSTVDQS